MANLISYTTDCPKCKENNVEAKLSLDMDSGKIICGANAAHEFEELPGETAPVLEDVKPDETNKLAESAGRRLVETEKEIDAASGQVRLSEIMAQRAPDVTVNPPIMIIPPTVQKELQTMEFKPSRVVGITADVVRLGEATILPGGDALCGIRLAETWVSALAAVGEESRPVRSVAEILQEIVDQAALEWFAPANPNR